MIIEYYNETRGKDHQIDLSDSKGRMRMRKTDFKTSHYDLEIRFSRKSEYKSVVLTFRNRRFQQTAWEMIVAGKEFGEPLVRIEGVVSTRIIRRNAHASD